MVMDVFCVLLAYCLGSLSFGLLIARLHKGVDIRHSGSGNIGATNVARTLGKTAGALTLLGDSAKGLLAVWLAQAWRPSALFLAIVALAAVLGHMFPVYHGFRGGKGVATALGVLIPTVPLSLLGGVVVWLVAAYLWRYVSLASMLAALAVPLLTSYWAYPTPLLFTTSLIAILILYKHRENWQRLRQGCEGKFS
ncbi:MAG: glycerol-3-phosphate 1-O-acyltransferase PlsY [Candidatus Tectomicrobia bacterium]|uniref:Glycerol-3-phosphate acyltransferase n=1 Tax=Tectimicrobiota bacterium TaxID=2528274 RepID=A0A937VX54_UNCTE|nr:glycerol-3-phosphate 1-O-acyltransferase PlsY [Candidatus Tectomicrobia bacterium]